MKKKVTAVLLLVICIFTTLFYGNEANAGEATNNEKQSIGYVFIGDSRTVGMNMSVEFDESKNKFMVAKVGMGYYWFINEGSEQLKDIGYESSDGLHYNSGTYQNLYDFIKVSIKVNEFMKNYENSSPDAISYMYN